MSAIAAEYTPEGEGLAGEGWDFKSEVIAGISTELGEPFLEAVVNSVWRVARVLRLLPDCQDVAWQLISVNIVKQTSADIEVINEELLGFEHTHTQMHRCNHVGSRDHLGTFPIWNSKGLCATVTKMAMHRCWFPTKYGDTFWNYHGNVGVCSRLKEEYGNVRRMHCQCG